jgi:hypothetical protein
MCARPNDPTLGRFLEVDPIPGGCANDYVYVHGDPVNASDLDGLRTCRTYSRRIAVRGRITIGSGVAPSGFLGFSLNSGYRTRVLTRQRGPFPLLFVAASYNGSKTMQQIAELGRSNLVNTFSLNGTSSSVSVSISLIVPPTIRDLYSGVVANAFDYAVQIWDVVRYRTVSWERC